MSYNPLTWFAAAFIHMLLCFLFKQKTTLEDTQYDYVVNFGICKWDGIVNTYPFTFSVIMLHIVNMVILSFLQYICDFWLFNGVIYFERVEKYLPQKCKMSFCIFSLLFLTRNLSLLFKIIQGLSNNCIEVGIMLYY